MAHFALHIKPAKSTLQALVLDLSVAILGGGGAEWVGEELTSLRDSNSCSYGGKDWVQARGPASPCLLEPPLREL